MNFLFQIILIVAGYEYINWRIKSKKSIKDWWDGYDKEKIYEIGIILSGSLSALTILFTYVSHFYFMSHLNEVDKAGLWMPLISYLAIVICLFCAVKKNRLSKK